MIVDGTVLPSPTATDARPTATRTVEPASPTPVPSPSAAQGGLRGFTWPIAGACLPDSDRLMPNSPREYRRGTHEGVDFYNLSSCAPVAQGTPVLAMAAGVVIRADHDYTDLTPAELAELNARVEACSCSEADVLDAFRGRQVWIDHGDGVVTRYAHLSAIEPSVYVGAPVTQGQAIAAVGDSGTPESLTAPGTEMHLHAEVWVGDSYVGHGQPPGEVRRLYEQLFSPAE